LQEIYDKVVKSYQEQLEQSQEDLNNFKDNYLHSATLPNFESSNDRWPIKTRMQSKANLTAEQECSVQSKSSKPVRVGELRAEILHLKVCIIKNKLCYQQIFA